MWLLRRKSPLRCLGGDKRARYGAALFRPRCTMADQAGEGYAIDALKPGMSATYERTVTVADIEAFAAVSGDHNPVHLDDAYAKTTMFKGRIAHGMLGASFIS